MTTNGLPEAQAQFDQFLEHVQETARSRARRIWIKAGVFGLTGKTPDSLAAFKNAAQLLPPSVDLAVARFKMGDALFAQGDFAGARENYEAVWQGFHKFSRRERETLVPQALYQTVRACMKLGDMAGTTNALARILTVYPTNNLADNSVLLVGEELSDLQQPASARALFEKFEELYPKSPLRPEVELALARTYEQEGSWPDAIGIYDRWAEQYTNDVRLLPQVEYARAWANFQAGRETNAFLLFTNFHRAISNQCSGTRRAMVGGRPFLPARAIS